MATPQATLVTGYCRLNAGHRGHDRFVELGNRLLGLGLPTVAFLDSSADFKVPESTTVYKSSLDDCYLYETTKSAKSPFPDDGKDTVDYMVVQHQKSAWLHEALDATVADVAVWVDLGILHVPGVTEEKILAFWKRLSRASTTRIALPSIWYLSTDSLIDYTQPAWYFAGGVVVMPRPLSLWFADRVETYARRQIGRTGMTTWEVNTWAAVARDNLHRFSPYQANHDGRIFDGYMP
jgi:hypothetical protein